MSESEKWTLFTSIVIVDVHLVRYILPPVISSQDRTGTGRWENAGSGGVGPVQLILQYKCTVLHPVLPAVSGRYSRYCSTGVLYSCNVGGGGGVRRQSARDGRAVRRCEGDRLHLL